jgi:hypothetical protein
MLVSCCVPVDSSICNVNGWIPQKLSSSVTRTHSFVVFRIHHKTPYWAHKSTCRLTFVPHESKVDSSHKIIVSGQEHSIPFIINILWSHHTTCVSQHLSLRCHIS